MSIDTWTRAKSLAKRIERDDPQCHVQSYRSYGSGGYGLNVVDTRTGIAFVVDSLADWQERGKATNAYDALREVTK